MGEIASIHSSDQNAPEPEITFDDFWALYPRRVAKKDARKAWDKVAPSLRSEVMTALFHWRRIWLERGELEFVPHAATWLNGERWTDELPIGAVPAPTAPVSTGTAQYSRQPMPQYVKDMIARMRAKQ